jgi:hypothetical protein
MKVVLIVITGRAGRGRAAIGNYWIEGKVGANHRITTGHSLMKELSGLTISSTQVETPWPRGIFFLLQSLGITLETV